jgi:Kef-type K+ transport system membrane component KefB
MMLICIYSLVLILGILVSQFSDLTSAQGPLNAITMICLGYIMIEVGLEFTINKKKLKSYGWDYIVAMTAAAFPWVFCAVYFIVVLQVDWKTAWLVGRFAAPTSAGVLFAMLLAAGLGMTWMFKKVRVLAIFDDLDTVLLMIPLKMMIVGLKPELFLVVVIITFLLLAAYKWLHVLKWSVGKFWIFGYAVGLFALCWLFEQAFHIHFEILLPAFVLGCILYHPHEEHHTGKDVSVEFDSKVSKGFDMLVKVAFMFLVGCSLPKIQLEGVTLGVLAAHVIALTVISNIGKCFPAFCYRKEASFRERLAVAVAMFPRGEVGAGVLLVAIGYGMTGFPVAVAGLSLALNLLLTGVFISIVLWLLKGGSEGSRA